MGFKHVSSDSELALVSYESLKSLLINSLKEKGISVLAICGGTSVDGIFSLLEKDKDLLWDKIHIVWVDERMVPISSDDSNYNLAYSGFIKTLIDSKKIPQENVHPYLFENDEKLGFGRSYYLRDVSSFWDTPRVLLLSIGEDGHVGALYPHHRSIMFGSEGGNDDMCCITMNDSPKPPSNRMTMSKNLISSSYGAVLVIKGEHKRNALDLLMNKEVSTIECPGKLVFAVPQYYIVTDL